MAGKLKLTFPVTFELLTGETKEDLEKDPKEFIKNINPMYIQDGATGLMLNFALQAMKEDKLEVVVEEYEPNAEEHCESCEDCECHDHKKEK